MIATRFLADCLHERNVAPVPGLLVGSLTLLLCIGFAVALAFYGFTADMPLELRVSSIINFLLLCAVWLVGIFISALRRYALITRAFFFGMVLSAAAASKLAVPYGEMGLLNGFSLGLALILALLIATTLAEYPHKVTKPFAFLRYFGRYWEIALAGLVYNMAIWVDKWIMWFAPEAVHLENGFHIYPHYDSAMFLAYLTTIPSMALFLFSSETNFFEKYARFFRDIREKATFGKIIADHKILMSGVFGSMRHFLVLQGGIALLGILMAPEIIVALEGDYLQIGMLRYGILGAMFHVFVLFLLVLLSYFDSRRSSLLIQCFFLLSNTLFTFAGIKLGFPYYGYGYFLSAFFTFLIAAIVTVRYLLDLPYHSFITANPSVQRA